MKKNFMKREKFHYKKTVMKKRRKRNFTEKVCNLIMKQITVFMWTHYIISALRIVESIAVPLTEVLLTDAELFF